MPSGITHGGGHCAHGGANGHHAHQRRGLRGAITQRGGGPGQHDVAQVARHAPEQRGGGQRDLAQLVVPQAGVAVAEVAHQRDHAVRQRLQRGFGARNLQVEQGGDRVEQDHRRDGRFGRGVNAGVDQRQVHAEQHRRDFGANNLAAQQHAHDDGADGQALDPAIGLHQLRGRQQLGQDAVLGRRVGRSAQAHHRISHQRVRAKQHHQAAAHLDEVRQEHHLALGHGVGKCAHHRGQHHIKQRKHGHQGGALPLGLAGAAQQLDGRHKQRVVSQRAEKLRRHDRVETFFHVLDACWALCCRPRRHSFLLRRGL